MQCVQHCVDRSNFQQSNPMGKRYHVSPYSSEKILFSDSDLWALLYRSLGTYHLYMLMLRACEANRVCWYCLDWTKSGWVLWTRVVCLSVDVLYLDRFIRSTIVWKFPKQRSVYKVYCLGLFYSRNSMSFTDIKQTARNNAPAWAIPI